MYIDIDKYNNNNNNNNTHTHTYIYIYIYINARTHARMHIYIYTYRRGVSALCLTCWIGKRYNASSNSGLAITGISLSDYFVSYPGHALAWGFYYSAEIQSVYSKAPADWARVILNGIINFMLQYLKQFNCANKWLNINKIICARKHTWKHLTVWKQISKGFFKMLPTNKLLSNI